MCKLVGFHTNMSCLGSVGYLMSGSGLEDLFRLIYGPESVNNFLVESGLMINPLTAVLATLENEVDVTVVLRVKCLCQRVFTDGICLIGDSSILSDPALQQVYCSLQS